jgi:hypothetical protein
LDDVQEWTHGWATEQLFEEAAAEAGRTPFQRKKIGLKEATIL